MSYIRHRGRDDWDRAEEIANGDVDRAKILHDALWEAYRVIAQLSYDCTAWPVDGYDKAGTLSLLSDMMGPKDISSRTYDDWQQRAYDLLQSGELS